MEEIKKAFTEMTNQELFCVLTGERGVMEQMYLQNILKEYMETHQDAVDLAAIVRESAAKE
ncbi:MAG: hypothetical protein IJ899_14865 [Blautia sp.]|nr:hypothetical protein [Blautia sp.]